MVRTGVPLWDPGPHRIAKESHIRVIRRLRHVSIMHTVGKPARGSATKKGETDVVRGVAQAPRPSSGRLPGRGHSPDAVGLPGGSERLGRVLARDGLP